MAGGYRCVQFDDLCRLCSNAGKNNIQIVSNGGDLQKKILECLPISFSEKDKLPKGICMECKDYVETFSDFRKATQNAQKLLEGCLNSTKLRNGGQVYIKDEALPKKVLKPIQNPSPTKILPNLNMISSTPAKQMKKNVIGSPNQNDLISSIMQAVGIQAGEDLGENSFTLSPANMQQQSSVQGLPQYTLTLDGGTLKSGGTLQYKIENSGNFINQSTPIISAANEEFLKLKQKPGLIVKKESPQLRLTASEDSRNKKPKINFVLQTTPQKQQQQQQQPKVQQSQVLTSSPPKTVSFASPPKAQILNIEKFLPATSQANQVSPTKQVIVPIMVRSDGTRSALTSTGSDATSQILQALQMSANQGLMSSDNKANLNSQPFMLMKIQPNSDGQFTLMQASAQAPTSLPPPPPQQLQISLTSQQLQQLGLQAMTSNHQPMMQQKQTISVQPTPLPVPSQVTHRAVSPLSETLSPLKEISSVAVEISNDEDMYNDSFDEDFYGDDDNENDSENNESHEKLMESKPSKKKSPKSSKGSKGKSSDAYEEPIINPEHSDQAKKQLSLLTSFSAKKTAIEELESKNDGINMTVCDVCKKVFKRKEFLMQHLKSHIGIRPFKCDEPTCNKSFSRKEHLLRHVSSHTGKKEFECNVCQKLFSRKDNLNKHRRIHPEIGHPNVRFSCPNCNKGFAHKLQLQKHHCEAKTNEPETVKIIKTTQQIVKKPKIKEERKEADVIQQTQQPPKLVLQAPTTQSSQASQLPAMKSESNPTQQIYLSLTQNAKQGTSFYTIPSNFILNSNGTFLTATAGNELGNLKFDTQ